MSSTVLAFFEFTNFPWVNLTSFSKRSKSPCLHRFSLRSIAALCSLLLEEADGFCRIKVGSTIKAFKATEFKSEFELNCFIEKVSSSIKAFPALPDGTLKIFLLKWTYCFVEQFDCSLERPLLHWTRLLPCFCPLNGRSRYSS